MNWIKPSLIFGMISLVVLLVVIVACTSDSTSVPPTVVAPATATVAPTPTVQVMPSLTPIPRSPTALPTATVLPSRTAVPTATVLPSRTAVPTTIFTPTPSPKDMLMAAFNKALAGLKTYRVEVPQESRYIAVQLPDRFIQEGEDGIVQIGATLWMVAPQGIRVGTGSAPFFDRANLNWYKDQFAQSPQVVLLGPGTAEGVPCVGYSANFQMIRANPPKTPGATPEISQVPVPVKIWFATTDGFPRRVDIGAPMSLTINFFDLNESIIITPP